MSIVARLLMVPRTWYQAARVGRPSPCRFEPSCSTYALEAIEGHGAVRGSWLAVRRIFRCRPGARFGWDPVPPPVPSSHSARPHPHERTVA